MFKLLLSLALLGYAVSTPALKSLEDARIVGGHDIDITEAPYQVTVLKWGFHSCGGTIIANDLIVTAAHCVQGESPAYLSVRAGSAVPLYGGQLVPVADLIWHPYFSVSKMDNDIALLWLSKPLQFNDKVAAIPMKDFGEEIADGEITLVSGWGNLNEHGGKPSTLQQVEVPTVNFDLCSILYSSFSITPTMLCAGLPEGGKDACQGDSGGPLVHDGKLAGVVSWGLGCARPNYPGVYTKISALRDWIDENMMVMRLKHMLRSERIDTRVN